MQISGGTTSLLICTVLSDLLSFVLYNHSCSLCEASLGHSISLTMWLHCAWCPDWGKGAFLSAASIQKPLVVLDTRLRTEGLSELTMVTAVKYSIFLLANEKQGQTVLPVPCLQLEGLGLLLAMGKVEDPTWQHLQVLLVELAAYSVVPFCQLCVWGRGDGGLLFVQASSTKIILAQRCFWVMKIIPLLICALFVYINTHIHAHPNVHTKSRIWIDDGTLQSRVYFLLFSAEAFPVDCGHCIWCFLC